MVDSTTNTVDVTDDLDAFSATFFGKDLPLPTEVTEAEDEEVSPESIDSAQIDEDDESAGDDTAEADEHAEEDEEEDVQPKPKSRKPARERINELTRARDAERLRADELARELEALKTPVKPQPVAENTVSADSPTPNDVDKDGKPIYALGEFDPAFIRDLTRFTIAQETASAKRELEVATQAREIQQAEQALLTQWNEKLADANERLPQLQEKSAELESTFRDLDPNYARYLAATIMTMDHGPDVLAYLADNLPEARKIVSSGATQATIALGRLEGRLTADKTGEREKIVTRAPPPPPARNKGSAAKASVAPDTDDLEAFEKVFFTRNKRF